MLIATSKSDKIYHDTIQVPAVFHYCRVYIFFQFFRCRNNCRCFCVEFRVGSRISGKGVQMRKGGVALLVLSHFS